MKITFISGGKKHEENLREAIEDYTGRLSKWYRAEWIFSEDALEKVGEDDLVVLLDESGVNMSTDELSKLIHKSEIDGEKRLVFVIGGAYGVTKEMKSRADYTWSLSRLTFPHMIARLILAESVYRAYSVLKGSKYHHS